MIGIFAILLTVTACEPNPLSDPTTPSAPNSVNLAKGCAVTVSTAEAANPKENLVDGDLDTQWSSEAALEDFSVDLGGVKQVSTIKLYPSYIIDGTISYILYCSTNGTDWVKVKDSPSYSMKAPVDKSSPLVLDGLGVSCRYLKVSPSNWPSYVAAFEFEVY
jgi:hypothetical protein